MKHCESERLTQNQKSNQYGSKKQINRVGGCHFEKLTRKHISIKCSKCKNMRHNSKSYKGHGGGSQASDQGAS